MLAVYACAHAYVDAYVARFTGILCLFYLVLMLMLLVRTRLEEIEFILCYFAYAYVASENQT